MNKFSKCLFVTSFSICCFCGIINSQPPTACTGSSMSDPDDCTKYYACVGDHPVSMSCPTGLNWNDQHKICDWPQNVKCKKTTKPDAIPVTPSKPSETPRKQPETGQQNVVKPNQSTSKCGPQKKSVCYFTNWAWYRQGAGKFMPEDIDPALCTHVNYAFAVLDGKSYTIESHDAWADIDNKFYEKVTALKKKGIKVLIAIGGWTDSEGIKYGPLLTDPQKRSNFVKSVVEYVKKYNFDGLDLDLEYPTCWQNNCEAQREPEKEGFAELAKELSTAFKPNGWLLSAAVSANPNTADAAYDIPKLSKYLDFINLMSYDYHGSWDKKTGHNAPFEGSDNLNVKASVMYWLKKGAASEKLILGIPTYGQSFTLANPRNNGFNAPTSGPGQAGQFTAAGGTLAFYEICANTKHNGWKVVRNKIGPYAYGNNQWVSFDDASDMHVKGKYICEMNLGGGMIWALDFDDFKGSCGCGKYPLLTAMNQEIRGIGGAPVKNCT